VAERTTLADLVNHRIDTHLAARGSILLDVAEDLAAVTGFSRQLLSGGKRFRARFCHLGWSCGPGNSRRAPDEAIVAAAAALEFFHAAALVHDDLIDHSDTRRGHASAHRHLEAFHRRSGFRGDAVRFGRSAAILTGDLLLAFSDELFDEALDACPDARGRAAKREFSRMRVEVTAGQYLDVLEESAWFLRDAAGQIARAETIAIYKSAKYSIEQPLAIGAMLGAVPDDEVARLRRYGLPLGIAYQLRDDLLGVYGDPAITGKPSGDDLREGKRTLLIALARHAMPAGDRDRLDRLLGDPQITSDEVAELQEAIRRSGAVRELEHRVEQQLAAADAALAGAPFDVAALDALRSIAAEAIHRDA
jgi:geranylgeranyl diphosphate synthase type I